MEPEERQASAGAATERYRDRGFQSHHETVKVGSSAHMRSPSMLKTSWSGAENAVT